MKQEYRLLTDPNHKPNQLAGIIISLLMMALGIFIQLSPNLKVEIQNSIPPTTQTFDDQLRYAPVALMYGASLMMPSSHNFIEKTALVALSYIVSDLLVYRTKEATQVKRPNSDHLNSFPSQHTNQAFMAAMLLHLEMGGSWLLSIIGFACALVVSYMRLGRNMHWSSDVLVGGSIGMLTVIMLYWLWDRYMPILKQRFYSWRNHSKESK